MSSNSKRSYNSQSRQTKAAETRSRILEAAKRLFQSVGFELVTIDQLAQAAEVSAPTIYALFHSKRGILHALLDEALPSTQREALVAEAKLIKSPTKRILYGAKIARQMYDAERDQMGLLQGASVLAPEFKELELERERRRYQRQEESVKSLAKQKALIKGLTITQARDIAWAFTGRDLYRMLVVERKWSSDQYEEWIGQMLIKSLIAP